MHLVTSTPTLLPCLDKKNHVHNESMTIKYVSNLAAYKGRFAIGIISGSQCCMGIITPDAMIHYLVTADGAVTSYNVNGMAGYVFDI